MLVLNWLLLLFQKPIPTEAQVFAEQTGFTGHLTRSNIETNFTKCLKSCYQDLNCSIIAISANNRQNTSADGIRGFNCSFYMFDDTGRVISHDDHSNQVVRFYQKSSTTCVNGMKEQTATTASTTVEEMSSSTVSTTDKSCNPITYVYGYFNNTTQSFLYYYEPLSLNSTNKDVTSYNNFSFISTCYKTKFLGNCDLHGLAISTDNSQILSNLSTDDPSIRMYCSYSDECIDERMASMGAKLQAIDEYSKQKSSGTWDYVYRRGDKGRTSTPSSQYKFTGQSYFIFGPIGIY